MAEQLPETPFERMTAEARDRERIERQKMLVSLPKGKLEQAYLAFNAGLTVEMRESLEELLLMANAMPNEPAAAGELRGRFIQATRSSLEKAARLHKISLVAAVEGPDAAQKVFNPAPTYGEMDDEETKMLEKFRKEREAAKKKEANEASKSGWKGMAAKRPTPYGGAGSGFKSGYGGGYGGGLSNWAIQQLLVQQLTSKSGDGAQGTSSGGKATAAASSGSSQQASGGNDYATRIALARIQYPCNN